MGHGPYDIVQCIVRPMTHGELVFQGSWIVRQDTPPMGHGLYDRAPPHGSWVVRQGTPPWVMGRTMVYFPMSHGSYDRAPPHGSWVVRQGTFPWVMDRTTVHAGHVTFQKRNFLMAYISSIRVCFYIISFFGNYHKWKEFPKKETIIPI